MTTEYHGSEDQINRAVNDHRAREIRRLHAEFRRAVEAREVVPQVPLSGVLGRLRHSRRRRRP